MSREKNEEEPMKRLAYTTKISGPFHSTTVKHSKWNGSNGTPRSVTTEAKLKKNNLYSISQSNNINGNDSHLQTIPNIINFGMGEKYTLMIMCMKSHIKIQVEQLLS